MKMLLLVGAVVFSQMALGFEGYPTNLMTYNSDGQSGLKFSLSESPSPLNHSSIKSAIKNSEAQIKTELAAQTVALQTEIETNRKIVQPVAELVAAMAQKLKDRGTLEISQDLIDRCKNAAMMCETIYSRESILGGIREVDVFTYFVSAKHPLFNTLSQLIFTAHSEQNKVSLEGDDKLAEGKNKVSMTDSQRNDVKANMKRLMKEHSQNSGNKNFIGTLAEELGVEPNFESVYAAIEENYPEAIYWISRSGGTAIREIHHHVDVKNVALE